MEHEQRHHREQYWGNMGGHPYEHGAHGRHPHEQEFSTYHEQRPLQGPPTSMQRQMEMEDAIAIARERVPGRVVKAELERRRGQLVYEIDIVTNQGVTYEVIVDETSGMVLSVEVD